MSIGNLFWWAIGTLGLGTTVLVVCGIVLGWPIVIAFLNTKLGRIGAIVGAVLVGFVFVYGKGKSDGAATVKTQEAKANADYVAKQDASNVAVAALPESELDKLLHNGK